MVDALEGGFKVVFFCGDKIHPVPFCCAYSRHNPPNPRFSHNGVLCEKGTGAGVSGRKAGVGEVNPIKETPIPFFRGKTNRFFEPQCAKKFQASIKSMTKRN